MLFFYDEKKGLSVHFLDVGQGDSTMFTVDGSRQILVDGGGNGKKLLSRLGGVMSPFDRTIEVVVLTHPDQDHLAGLIDILEVYNVGVFLHNGQTADTEIFQQLEEVLENSNIRQEIFGEGSKISLSDELKMTAFNPDIAIDERSDRNEHSIVFRIDYGKNSFLLTGDADEQTEDDMILDMEDVDVDWLKVGHHGSKHSTTDEFLYLVSPSYAIISVGKSNRYGHPDPEVLERLSNIGAEILRTDEWGTITVECETPQAECILE